MEEKWFKLLKKYSERFGKKYEDIDDAVSEACLLYLENPPDPEKLNKTFFWKLAKRGKYHLFYYNKKNEKNLLNFDTKSQEALEYAVDENYNIDRNIEIKEVVKLAENIKFGNIERQIFNKIVEGKYNYTHADRGHFYMVQKKVREYFKGKV